MSQDQPAPSNRAALAAGDQRVLARVFQHPQSHNLSWRETLALTATLGSVGHAHDGDVVLRIGQSEGRFRPGRDKDLSAEALMSMRHLLTRAGWGASVAVEAAPPIPSDIVVIIDHAGARVFLAAPDDGATPQELQHIDCTQHDADREEGYSADTQFFDAVAAAVSGDGRIVVIGHGKGKGNEADHLMAHLARHHSAVHARVAREIVVDLPHLTVPQLLSLARHALQPARESAVPQGG